MIYSNHLKKNCKPKIVCLEKLLISFSSEGEASEAQDGRLEGHLLTTSYENIRITSNSWTTIEKNKKNRSYQKITLHPKSKKPQQDGKRNIIMMKSNSIPAGWVTSWKTILLQKLSHWNESSEHPHQDSQPGRLATEGEASRESGFEDHQGLIIDISQDWGKQTHHSLSSRTRSLG